VTISLKEFFLHEENSQTYAAQVHAYAVPGNGDPVFAERHLDSLEHAGVAPHAAAQIMIRKHGWQDTQAAQQSALGEHQDPTKPVDKGASIWSDPDQPVDVRKFSSCGGNLHIDLTESPEAWWPGKDEEEFDPKSDPTFPDELPPDIELQSNELHPDEVPVKPSPVDPDPETTLDPAGTSELPDVGFGFDSMEDDPGFGAPPPRDPRWAQSAESMDWDEFKQRHPKVAKELDSSVIDSTQLAQAIFKARVGTPSSKDPDMDRSDFFSAKFPDGRTMMYVGDNRGWQDMGGKDDDENDPDDPGPKYDDPSAIDF
jgi:hypothetical protein